jgi:20S proteasome subunit alpha 6
VNNTSIGILGALSQFEEKPVAGGAFRILENSFVEPFLKTMVPKDTAAATTTAPAAQAEGGGDADVQMTG